MASRRSALLPDFRASGERVVDSIVPALQIVIAATLSYSIAFYVLGHPAPLLAVTITVTTIGFARDSKPIRVLESAAGIVIGILVSELLLLLVGRGVWQVAVVLLSVLLLARLFSRSNAFATAAGVQSVLVMVLPPPVGGPFSRSIDALLGGIIALTVTVVLPRDPRRFARLEAKRVLADFAGALHYLVTALQSADEPSAQRALERLHGIEPLLSSWRGALDSAKAITRVSPFLRRHGPELEEQAVVLHGMDMASRNLGVISRRIDFLIRDGVPRPEIASLLARLATSVSLLGESIDDPRLADTVRFGLVAIAERLGPEQAAKDVPVGESVVIIMLRPLLVDLLSAAGLTEDKARATLPKI